MTQAKLFNTVARSGFFRICLNLLAASAILSLAACAIKESTDPDGGGSIVVSVSDTSKINIEIKSKEPQVFIDSGEFSLDEIRARMADKDINSDSVKITGLSVTYDESTKQFLAENKGVRFVLKLYTRENGAATEKLTLETGSSVGALAPLSFDPDAVLFELNKQLFGHPDGFPGVLIAIKDKTKHTITFIAKLEVLDGMKTTGVIKLNMVVTVAGKV